MNTATKKVNANDKRSDDMNALMTECKVFWAFSNSQFEEGKIKVGHIKGEKLIDIGAGGFMPAVNKDKFIQGMKNIAIAFKQAMKDEKARKAHIAYELNNHEAFYTRDITSTLEALGDDFTREEVLAVYKHPKNWK